VEPYLHSLNTPSRLGAQLSKKHGDSFTFTLPSSAKVQWSAMPSCGDRLTKSTGSVARCSWLSRGRPSVCERRARRGREGEEAMKDAQGVVYPFMAWEENKAYLPMCKKLENITSPLLTICNSVQCLCCL